MAETEDYDKSATPLAHKTTHQDGGSDEISVAGLSGLLGDGQTPLAHKTSHQLGGSDALSVAGLSGLLADPQTPLAHAHAWADVSKSGSNLTDIATRSHTSLSDIATLTHATLDSYLDQAVKQASGPTLAHLHLSDLAAIYTPAESWIGPSLAAGIYFKGGAVGIGTIPQGAYFHVRGLSTRFWVDTTGTSSIYAAYILKIISSGDMADNFGCSINFQIQDDSGVENLIGLIGFRRSGADNSGQFTIRTYNAGVALSSLLINPNGDATFLTSIKATTAFGCNAKDPQTPYASGGALAAYANGAFGLDSANNMSALHAMVVSIRAALVANGIMS